MSLIQTSIIYKQAERNNLNLTQKTILNEQMCSLSGKFNAKASVGNLQQRQTRNITAAYIFK